MLATHPRNESGTAAAVAVRRFVNDEIADAASRFDANDGSPFEFVCECGALSCDGRVTMTLAEYHATVAGSVVVH